MNFSRLEAMPESFLRDLELVLNLAEGNCLDQEVDIDDIDESDDIDLVTEAQRQRRAIEQIREFLNSQSGE